MPFVMISLAHKCGHGCDTPRSKFSYFCPKVHSEGYLKPASPARSFFGPSETTQHAVPSLCQMPCRGLTESLHEILVRYLRQGRAVISFQARAPFSACTCLIADSGPGPCATRSLTSALQQNHSKPVACPPPRARVVRLQRRIREPSLRPDRSIHYGRSYRKPRPRDPA
jgi:hypothetical protein